MKTCFAVAAMAAAILTCGDVVAQTAKTYDDIPSAYAARNLFMGSVLVAKDGKVLLDKGYGDANLEWKIANTPDTKFRLASLTKQFTAAAILLLEDRGKLSTDDPVKKYVPDAPAAWDKVTIYNLLTHTSGIPSFTDFPDYRETQLVTTTVEKLVARFRDKPLDFQPGENWKYSNSGYALLGYIIEKVSRQTYAEFLRQNIFAPLRMADTGYDSNRQIIARRASGYSRGHDGIENAGYIDMTVPYAAGGLYSTTHDLLRWEEGLFGGKLLSEASFKKMTTPFKNGYACGLAADVDPHVAFWHAGGIDGFSTALSYFPDQKMTVVVLGNLAGQVPQTIAGDLAHFAYGGTVALKIDPAKE